MSSLNDMQKRITYRGGARQIDRMIKDKARSLDKALIYSYSSATAVLADGREFRCLINPNRLTMELDDKMISIPFEDICLNKEKQSDTTSSGLEKIGVKVGDVISWKENNSHWLIYSQYLQETAYFRGLMRLCENEALEINGNKYYYYLQGASDKGIDWQKTKRFIFNNLSYSAELYISNTVEASEFFHRFTKVKLPIRSIDGKVTYRPYEVQGVDDISYSGLLTVLLKEDYSNQWEEETKEETGEIAEVSAIKGLTDVYPYDIIQYSIEGFTGGKWSLSNDKARIVSQNDTSVTIEIITGKSGSVDLIYRLDEQDIIYNILIKSL